VLKVLATGFVAMVALSACTATAKYDIDVACQNTSNPYDFTEELLTASADDPLEYIFCAAGHGDFTIACSRPTVQRVGRTVYCSTTDKKTVRIENVLAP
jgi:hypothetical protein